MSIDVDPESFTDDLGSYSIDVETQLQPGDTLVDRGVDDVLDEGYSPADTPRGALAWGTTVYEQAHRETIDQRLCQEEPDVSADGDYDERQENDGRGERRAGRLVSPDEGAHNHVEHTPFAADLGIDGAGASAEEAAMHVVDWDDLARSAEDDI
jgi:hypothetical protein